MNTFKYKFTRARLQHTYLIYTLGRSITKVYRQVELSSKLLVNEELSIERLAKMVTARIETEQGQSRSCSCAACCEKKAANMN
jgi:hypothetical protein